MEKKTVYEKKLIVKILRSFTKINNSSKFSEDNLISSLLYNIINIRIGIPTCTPTDAMCNSSLLIGLFVASTPGVSVDHYFTLDTPWGR